jgi:uncharacterized protein DUF3253
MPSDPTVHSQLRSTILELLARRAPGQHGEVVDLAQARGPIRLRRPLR